MYLLNLAYFNKTSRFLLKLGNFFEAYEGENIFQLIKIKKKTSSILYCLN